MKILFSGTFPGWLALALMAAGLLAVWKIYRRQRLPSPWRWLLPAMRSLVVIILTLALLQPVVSRHWRKTVRGKIAVLVDDSASMSIIDTYSPGQRVLIAWELVLFPRELRTTAFGDGRTAAARVEKRLAKLSGDANMAKQQLPLPQRTELGKIRLRHQSDLAADIVREIDDLLKTLTAAAGDAPYLASSGAVETPSGRLSYERFDNIPGETLDSLRAAPRFPASPDTSIQLTEFRAPADAGENYGARIRGFLSPPASGVYTFSLAADDQAALFIGEGTAADERRLLASVPAWVPQNDYGKYPEQRSAGILLEKGKEYYLEALLKENFGDDHGSVAWTRPDGTAESPIPGIYFRPVGQTVEQARFVQDFSGFTMRVNAILGTLDTFGKRLDNGLAGDDRGDAKPRDNETGAKLADQALAEWRSLMSGLDNLQRQADEALAGGGILAVETALNKLARMPRIELARHLLLKGALRESQLGRFGDAELFTLNEPARAFPFDWLRSAPLSATRSSTRLGSAIQNIFDLYGQQPLAAVIVLTDGNSNAGRPLHEINRTSRELNIPILGIGLGSPDPPHDIALDNVEAPRNSFRGDRLVFRATLRRHGYAHRPVRVWVSRGGEIFCRETVPAGGGDVVPVELSFVETHAGYHHYVVVAEAMGGEVLPDNNRQAVSVNILTDPVNVLLVDQFPRWETRHARMMLERDPRVEVQTIFSGSGPEAASASGIPDFPGSRDKLSAFDVVALGDIPPRHFTAQQLADIEWFVLDRGGCLVLMAGPHFMPRQYRETPLAEIFPFKVEPRAILAGAPPPLPGALFSLRLTEEGRHEAAVQTGMNSDDSDRLWRRLPPMNWIAEGIHPSSNATILATTSTGDSPVILKSHAGLGRIIFLGTDSFWRWRPQNGRIYHHRLWGQLLLWATVDRTTGSDEYVKLMTDRPEYSPGETITLKARILGRDKLPLENATASATIVDREGATVKSVRFSPLPNSGGEYRAQIRDLPKGKYTVVPRVLELKNVEVEANCPFEIRDLPTSELVDLKLDTAALQILTTRHWSFLEAQKALDHIPKIELSETHRRDFEVWDSAWTLCLVALLLAGEWHLRKKFNLL